MIDKAKSSGAAGGALDGGERKKLLVRIGIAGAAIVALIGALALFEQSQREVEPNLPKGTSTPENVPGAPGAASGNQASGTIPPNEPAVADAKPELKAEPESSAAPVIAQPKAEKGEKGGRTETAPEDSHPRLVVGKGGEPHKAAPSPAEPAVKVPVTEASKAAPGEVPKASTPEAAPLKPGSGYLVQVGVFSNLGNAEELRKRLVDAGIPAQIEARVQIGPFATQAEAAAAQQKLKALGMEPGMLVPPKRP